MKQRRYIFIFCLLTVVHVRTSSALVAVSGYLSDSHFLSCQMKIQMVLAQHRSPTSDSVARPWLVQDLSLTPFEKRIRQYGERMRVVESVHGKFSATEIRAELQRIIDTSEDNRILSELFESLNNNSSAIVECLVQPTLVETLYRNLYFQGLAEPEKVTSIHRGLFSTDRIPFPEPMIVDQSSSFYPNRSDHLAVWTGTEMIIVGGALVEIHDHGWGGPWAQKGEIYTPATNSWRLIENGPIPTQGHACGVWTGREMIIWGGEYYPGNSGSRYDPVYDKWTAMSTVNTPIARSDHACFWTGREVIVWGGRDFAGTPLRSGGRYSPESDSWQPTSFRGAPSARLYNATVWTGKEMIVWGGHSQTFQPLRTGARYDPHKNGWKPTRRSLLTDSFRATWTGREMIAWGKSIGGQYMAQKYDPDADSWSLTSPPKYQPYMDRQMGYDLLSAGGRVIVWGGTVDNISRKTGLAYNPKDDSWTDVPPPRFAVATSDGVSVTATASGILLWGGIIRVAKASDPYGYILKLPLGGARYDVLKNKWYRIQ